MQDMVIPVAFTPDENYIIPTCVAIVSMLRNKKKNTKYKFYIVISDKFNKEYLKFFERIEELEREFDYQVISFDSDIFDSQKITTRHLTTSAYYRLALSELLTEYDKCLYQDGDILVNTDLQEMFDVDLDAFYVAGIRAIDKFQETEQNQAEMRKWGFPSFDNYIISSNLVMNLFKIRENGLTEEFKRRMGRGYPSEDQDVINLCCYGGIFFLPLKFGMLNRWLYNNALGEMKKQIYTYEEILEAKKFPAIVHFAGKNTKPWCNLRTAYGEAWWKYAKEILTDSEYAKWHQRAEETTKKRDWNYLKKVLVSYKSILIFGNGKAGKEVFSVLKRWGYNVECFVDNDLTKQGNCYKGCRILSVENALHEFQESVIVNTVYGYRNEIRNQLVMMGMNSDRIIDYEVKNEIYYLALAPEWREYEFKDMCVKEFGWNADT